MCETFTVFTVTSVFLADHRKIAHCSLFEQFVHAANSHARFPSRQPKTIRLRPYEDLNMFFANLDMSKSSLEATFFSIFFHFTKRFTFGCFSCFNLIQVIFQVQRFHLLVFRHCATCLIFSINLGLF